MLGGKGQTPSAGGAGDQEKILLGCWKAGGKSQPGPEELSISSLGHLFPHFHDLKIPMTSAPWMQFEQEQQQPI